MYDAENERERQEGGRCGIAESLQEASGQSGGDVPHAPLQSQPDRVATVV